MSTFISSSFFLEQPQIDDSLLTSFLEPSSLTLKTLCLFSVMLKSSDSQSGGDLRMNSLEILSLAGNVQLINYFSEVYCPKLQRVILTPYYYKESHLQINYDGLRRLLKLSSKSLLDLEIKPLGIDRDLTHQIKEDNKTETIDLCSRTTAELKSSGQIESVTFDKSERLELEIDGVKIIEYFSFNQYPRLTNFSLESETYLESMFMENSVGFPIEQLERVRREQSERVAEMMRPARRDN